MYSVKSAEIKHSSEAACKNRGEKWHFTAGLIPQLIGREENTSLWLVEALCVDVLKNDEVETNTITLDYMYNFGIWPAWY